MVTNTGISRNPFAKSILLALVAAMPQLPILRAVCLTEGVFFVVMLLVAMPLKCIWHWPLAVNYVGWTHGMIIIALRALALNTLLREPRDRISGDACRS